ncbi:MAG: PorT family protein [Cyclobacteriaceae bacterium]|nr:PorT family protein [Cyclobacteriaceae bacterium]
MKAYLLIVLIFTCNVVSFAQKSSIRFQVGYGMGLNSQYLPEPRSLGFYPTPILKGSYGSGIQMELGYVYTFKSPFSFQIDANFLRSENLVGNLSTPTFTEPSATSSTQASFVSIAPLFRVNINKQKLQPFFAIGPVIGTALVDSRSKYVYQWYTARINSTVVRTTTDVQQEFTGSAVVGLKSILGMQYSFQRVSIYSQISFTNISYTTNKARIISLEVDGIDILSKATDANALPAGMVLPFSSLSFNIGLAVKL